MTGAQSRPVTQSVVCEQTDVAFVQLYASLLMVSVMIVGVIVAAKHSITLGVILLIIGLAGVAVLQFCLSATCLVLRQAPRNVAPADQEQAQLISVRSAADATALSSS